MKVLVVSQYYYPEPFRISDFVSALRRAGCDVQVLTGQPNYPGGFKYPGYSWYKLTEEFYDYIKIWRVPLLPRGQKSAFRLILNYLSFMISATFFGMWKLRAQSFDYIIVYGTSPILQAFPALTLGRFKKAKVIIWVQDLWPESLVATNYVKNGLLIAVVRQLVAWIYKRCDLLLAQSEGFISVIKRISCGTPVRYFPQPGESLPPAAASKPPAFILGDGFNVVFAGNLGRAQALDTILDAAKILQRDEQIRFFLIGNGSETQRIQDRILRENIKNVILPGRFPSSEMSNIYTQASVLLLSLDNSDSLNITIPGKLQTYLSQGKPIVASMNGEGARIVLEAGAGLVSAAGDHQELAKSICYLKSLDCDILNSMGKNGSDYYLANFDIDMLAKNLLSILGDLK